MTSALLLNRTREVRFMLLGSPSFSDVLVCLDYNKNEIELNSPISSGLNGKFGIRSQAIYMTASTVYRG